MAVAVVPDITIVTGITSTGAPFTESVTVVGAAVLV